MSADDRGAALLCTLAAGLLLAGCGNGAPADATPTDAGAAAGAQPRTVAGKPAGPIALSHELLDTPSVGQPLRVRVTAVPRRDVEALTLEARGSAALALAALPVEPAVDIAAGEAVTRTFTVYPMEEGRHSLDVVAEGLVAGEPQAGRLTVAVRVGTARAAATSATQADAPDAPQTRTDAAGQRLRSLPAQER